MDWTDVTYVAVKYDIHIVRISVMFTVSNLLSAGHCLVTQIIFSLVSNAGLKTYWVQWMSLIATFTEVSYQFWSKSVKGKCFTCILPINQLFKKILSMKHTFLLHAFLVTSRLSDVAWTFGMYSFYCPFKVFCTSHLVVFVVWLNQSSHIQLHWYVSYHRLTDTWRQMAGMLLLYTLYK
jgi:hypothetical protein